MIKFDNWLIHDSLRFLKLKLIAFENLTESQWKIPRRLSNSLKEFQSSFRKRNEKWSHQSKTKRVMYSLGIRGNWWEKTFWRPTNHDIVCLVTFWVKELPTTWNEMRPRLSSCLAASSRGAFSGNTLCTSSFWKKILHHQFKLFDTHAI